MKIPKPIVVAATLALAACGGSTPHESGQALVRVEPLAGADQVTRIELEVAGVVHALALDAATGTFAGVIVVPAGTHTFTARAYDDVRLVGQGSATVAIAPDATTRVVLYILDTTGPGEPVDHAPVIVAHTAPGAAQAGAAATLTVEAMDPDGDPLTYAWADDCGGTFADPAAPVTTWTRATAGECAITVTVAAKGLADAATFGLTVLPAGSVAGQAAVSGWYVTNPEITWFALGPCGFSREQPAQATCPVALAPGATYEVTIAYDLGPGGGWELMAGLSADCGGTIQPTSGGTSSRSFRWTTPTTPGVCMVTAQVRKYLWSGALADTLAMAVQLDPGA